MHEVQLDQADTEFFFAYDFLVCGRSVGSTDAPDNAQKETKRQSSDRPPAVELRFLGVLLPKKPNKEAHKGSHTG